MKKKWLMVLMILFLCFSFVSCDEDREAEGNNTAEVPEQETTIKGEQYETDDFSMIIADGFSKLEIDGGVQAYKSNDVIEIWLRGFNNTENDAKSGAENLSKTHKGTEVQKTNLFGLDFYQTTFEAFGNPQTVYVGIKDGKKVQIGVAGKGHENNEILQGMFKSISFK